MAFLQNRDVEIIGLAACVPKNISENIDLSIWKNNEAAKFISSTGIERRRISDDKTTTSDLCFHASEKLIKELHWDKKEIDCLIFVTQTPDYLLPATSCILQNRLNLSQECYTLDISLGCSGWIYGVSVISSLMQSGHFKKGLLLVGDTVSKTCSKDDKSTLPLFGDSGTATAFRYNKNSENPGLKFHLSTDGNGYNSIIIPAGGQRTPFNENSLIKHIYDENILRSDVNLSLNGMDVFSFGISKAPDTINKLFANFCIDLEQIDFFYFHQANLFMNEKIRKKLNLSPEKVPYSLKDFGNTSSASIPLTMVTSSHDNLTKRKQTSIACGFGVGLSWGSLLFQTENIVCIDLIEI
jgi:3-oxoacyl-[acyl-carrier-protein] synthase-3